MALNTTSFQLLDLPTNYEYYTSGGIKSGLSADQPYFTLNDKNISIYSGAMHYFRVPRAYWRDRLRKMRAAGLNTVETIVPWNLHEHQSGSYDFGDGGSDMQDFLNITEFLKTAQEEDLFAILRPGPFVCGEFEFGGFPSWLLREDGIKVRTSDSKYMEYVNRFFNVLMPILALLQFTKGGPVIALQVENEYGAMTKDVDKEYLKDLRQLMLDNGIVELLVTSDNPSKGDTGSIPELFLLTANFDSDPVTQLGMMEAVQPGKPLMTMEYYSGWFDFWGEEHNTKSDETFRKIYEGILSYPSSVNIYMFHGGTNFGFLNGAQNLKHDSLNTEFEPTTTSYDYDSPLSEGGDYTEKYRIIQKLLSEYNPLKTKIPDSPITPSKVAYPNITLQGQLPLESVLDYLPSVSSPGLIPMEKLDINNNSGQSYGYIVYRKENLNIKANATLLLQGRVCDTVIVLVNGVLVSPALENSADLDKFGTWRTADSTITLTSDNLEDATLDLVVENWGRVNIHSYNQFKGLHQGPAFLDDVELKDWTIFPLEFKTSWTNGLSDWDSVNLDTVGPSLYKTVLEIEDEPRDTFFYMENWVKGIVIVNGFVLGRYAHMGPVQTLYLPAPFLKQGENSVVVFEHFRPGREIAFTTAHVYVTH